MDTNLFAAYAKLLQDVSHRPFMYRERHHTGNRHGRCDCGLLLDARHVDCCRLPAAPSGSPYTCQAALFANRRKDMKMAGSEMQAVLVRMEDVLPFCPAKHHATRSWPVLTRGLPPFAGSLEVSVAEIDPGGWIDEHVHVTSDHGYLVTGGEATAIIDGEKFYLCPGSCLFIPRGICHELKTVEGPDTFTFVVFWTPARSADIAMAAEEL